MNSFSVRCGDYNIASQEKVKYLGLTIDNILSGEDIVNGIIQKVNSRLKNLETSFGLLKTRLLDLLNKKHLGIV